MKRAAYAFVGALAVIGAVVVAVNVGWNMGVLPVCGSPVEKASSSPDGKLVLIVGVANCGRSTVQTEARIVTESGKTYLVFLGSAEAEQPILYPDWIGPTKLRLSYLRSAALRFPVGHLDGLHSFGEVEVTYEAQDSNKRLQNDAFKATRV
jgi:hypothetical protein